MHSERKKSKIYSCAFCDIYIKQRVKETCSNTNWENNVYAVDTVLTCIESISHRFGDGHMVVYLLYFRAQTIGWRPCSFSVAHVDRNSLLAPSLHCPVLLWVLSHESLWLHLCTVLCCLVCWVMHSSGFMSALSCTAMSAESCIHLKH